MSDLFSVLSVSGSGLNVYKTWLDAVSDNVANINTIRPTSGPAFQERFVVAQSVGGGPDGTGAGAQVSGIALGSAAGVVTYDPSNPLADAKGMVRAPNMDLGDQMTSMMLAQRAYQANLAVISRAQTAYQAALQIGNGA